MSDMTMVERVARAIANAPWHVGQGHEICVDMARAAIAEMREPTEAMQHAGLKALADGGLGNCDCDQVAVWQAGIDAALSEQKP